MVQKSIRLFAFIYIYEPKQILDALSNNIMTVNKVFFYILFYKFLRRLYFQIPIILIKSIIEVLIYKYIYIYVYFFVF